MITKLLMGIVVVTVDSRIFESAVHALDLPIRPRMFRFGEAVVNAMLETNPVKQQLEGILVARTISKLNPVVSQDGVDFIGNSSEKMAQEFGSDKTGRLLVYLNKGKLRSTINCHKQVKLAFFRLYLRDVDVKIANGIGFEACFLRCLLGKLGQPANSVSLKTAMQR